MTGTAPEGPPPPDDLTARVFRALYPEFDLHALDGTYLAVPAGTPCFTAPAIGEVARQISTQAYPDPGPPPARPCPDLPRRP
jgi:hypothetical protein